jgi:ribulose-phosphate 3-epimerase
MKYYLSPSLACGNLINIEKLIRDCETANVDMLHIDVMDNLFMKTLMFSPKIITEMRAITKIPLQVHLMINNPEVYINQYLENCRPQDIISYHAESTTKTIFITEEIRRSGCIPSIAINRGSPLSVIDEVIMNVGMVLAITADVGGPKQTLDDYMIKRVEQIRKKLDDVGRSECLIGIDGSVSFENARSAYKHGANVFVLGTTSIFIKDTDLIQNCNNLRKYLDKTSKQ